MRKYLFLFALLFFSIFSLSACSSDKEKSEPSSLTGIFHDEKEKQEKTSSITYRDGSKSHEKSFILSHKQVSKLEGKWSLDSFQSNDSSMNEKTFKKSVKKVSMTLDYIKKYEMALTISFKMKNGEMGMISETIQVNSNGFSSFPLFHSNESVGNIQWQVRDDGTIFLSLLQHQPYQEIGLPNGSYIFKK